LNQRFPKSHRLLKRNAFRLVYDTGTPYRNGGFHLFVRRREAAEPTRLGITTTRALGQATARNRVRRLVRENFRLAYSQLRPGHDIVVNCRQNLAGMTRSEFDRLFQDIVRKARLLEPDSQERQAL
jgi:ribonuclease P protein component